MTVGDKLKKARQLNNWTQAQFALIVNLPVSRIQQYESGVRNPKPIQLKEFANALGVSIEYLTDYSLNTYHDVMFALFELEDTFNLKIENINGKYTITFDDTVLKNYISKWGTEKDKSKLSQETLEKYIEWKMRFPHSGVNQITNSED